MEEYQTDIAKNKNDLKVWEEIIAELEKTLQQGQHNTTEFMCYKAWAHYKVANAKYRLKMHDWFACQKTCDKAREMYIKSLRGDDLYTTDCYNKIWKECLEERKMVWEAFEAAGTENETTYENYKTLRYPG